MGGFCFSGSLLVHRGAPSSSSATPSLRGVRPATEAVSDRWRIATRRACLRERLISTAILLLVLTACTAPARPEAEGDATSPPPQPTGSPVSSQSPRQPKLSLGIAGIGVALLGDGVDETIRSASAVLGRPSKDTGWIRSFSEFGTCPGERIRAVMWGQFRLLFTDGATDHGHADRPHFFEWDYGPGRPTPALATAEGITLGSSIEQVRRAYPSADFEWDHPMYGPNFIVRGPSELGFLWGFLSGSEAASEVTFLAYGAPHCGE